MNNGDRPVLASVLCLVVLLVGCASQQTPGAGLHNGKLTACGGPPRCVNSEFPDAAEFHVEPLSLYGKRADTVWPALLAAVDEMGGIVARNDGGYLSASFMTPIMKFIDDLECRLDSNAGVIQVRSASRIGYYDFAANRKRVAQLRGLLQAKLAP